jgi:hypothetical protein
VASERIHEDASTQRAERDPAGPVEESPPSPVAAAPLARRALPVDGSTLGLRQAEALRLQRRVGNQATQRILQRQETGPGGPNEIGDGSASVRASGGTVEVEGGAVNVHAGLTQFDGVIQTPMIIADSVVASSYTPGAGNVF